MKNAKFLLVLAFASLLFVFFLDGPFKYVIMGFSTVAFLAVILQSINKN